MTTTLRGEAGMAALRGGGATSPAQYLEDWDDGADGRSGTADDREKYGQASLFNTLAGYGARGDSADWDRVQELHAGAAPNGVLPSFVLLPANPAPMSSLNFYKSAGNKDVTVERFIRQLFVKQDSVSVKHEVCLPSATNLY